MTYECLKTFDRRRTSLIADWEKCVRSADKLYARFTDRVGDSPFDYHEVASVGFLASSAAMAGFLPMNEYDVIKRGQLDKRKKVKGRANLWMDAGNYCYSLEVKRTRRPVTALYLLQRLDQAFLDVECVQKDECHVAAACLVTVARDQKREVACRAFAEHDEVDFSYRIGPKGEPAFLYFRLKG